MTEPKKYKIRGEATSFDPKTARFEGEITVWLEDQPPVEPPPSQPAFPATRLAQHSTGVAAYQNIPESTDPFDVRAHVSTYGYQCKLVKVIQPGQLIAPGTKHYGIKSYRAKIRQEQEQKIELQVGYYGVSAQTSEVIYRRIVCNYKEWLNAFNGRAFNSCTWNDVTFGERH